MKTIYVIATDFSGRWYQALLLGDIEWQILDAAGYQINCKILIFRDLGETHHVTFMLLLRSKILKRKELKN